MGVELNVKPIIKKFVLKRVNGYKDLEVSFSHGVKILAAENGAGKTTLLNALYAILTGNLKSLLKIDFDSFLLTINDQEFSLHRDQISSVNDDVVESIYRSELATRLNLPRPSKWDIEEVVLSLSSGEDDSVFESSYFGRAMKERGYPLSYYKLNFIEMLPREIREVTIKKAKFFANTHAKIEKALDGISILYLPTYRRIEAEMPEYRVKKAAGIRRHDSHEWTTNRLIYFGLYDVESKLDELSEEIRRTAVRAYSNISAQTLDNLLFGNNESNVSDSSGMDLKSLKVVLARIGRDNITTTSALENFINSGEINHERHGYLRNFLNQLLENYRKTQDKEVSIEKFVAIVNSYLLEASSEKVFYFDKLSAEAKIVNRYTGLPLPLSALSSGEKQIVSVFARLYLGAGKNLIVLIDEPELSLSMEWQKKFLPDIVHSQSCAQLIAITHSPFTFENELDRFAGSIKVKFTSEPLSDIQGFGG